MTDPRSIAETYFTSWKAKDFETLRGLLADNVTFSGPLAQIEGIDPCMDGLQGMAQIITDIEIHKIFVDGPDVLTWYDLHTSVAAPIPTANWSRVAESKIFAIRVAFDARPFAG